MFTGIIEATAKVRQKTASGLVVERPSFFDDIKEGNSISVSGACLSITKFDHDSLSFDVVAETWARTKLGDLQVGDLVNLERSLAANGRFEGHSVQGHIEGVATVDRLDTAETGAMLYLTLPNDLSSPIIPKGSIAIDGVSLTVASINGAHLSIALIPHTLQHTTLGNVKPQDHVNIETDVLGRYTAALLAHR